MCSEYALMASIFPKGGSYLSTQKRAQTPPVEGVFKRGSTFHLRYRVDGRQIRCTLATEDEQEAYRRARRILFPLPDDPEEKRKNRAWKAEVRAYIGERTKDRRMTAATGDLRSRALNRFADSQTISAPRLVTSRAVRDWYQEIKTGEHAVSEETAQTYVRWLMTFLRHLSQNGYPVPLPDVPKFPRLKKRLRQRFCTSREVARLIAAAPNDQMRFILYAGFHTGLRRGEIAEARPEWFDLNGGLLNIERSDTWEPKDRDARTIPLTEEFAAFLRSYGPPAPFCLPGRARQLKRPGKWRYRYDFRKPFDALMTKCGMEWVTPHTMRRTFASLKVSAGVSLYKVAVWLGDMESVVQDHYGYLIPKDSDIERGF